MAAAARQGYDRRVSTNNIDRRCPWCLGSEAYVAYHDREWGTPVHDERMLFELAYELEAARPWAARIPPTHV